MRKSLFIISIFLASFVIVIPSNAQWKKQSKDFTLNKFKEKIPELLSLTNAGKEFWVTFLPCFESANAVISTLKVYVSSAVKTVVTLEIPGKGYYNQRPTIPNDIIEFTIDPSLGQPYRKTDLQPAEPEQVYPGFGLHIFADDPIIVYGVTRFTATSDSYLALPVSSLGKEYIVASWADIADNGVSFGQYLPSYTACVAAFDRTVVRFTLGGTNYTTTAGGMKPGETKSVTLYKGDVFMLGSFGNLADLSGSKWRATKPVAVISGSYAAYIPTNICCWDYIVEMELPTNTWGKEYHYTPIAGRLKNSMIKIFAKENNTNVNRDGNFLGTINYAGGLEGEGWFRMRAGEGSPKPFVFSADKPISVTQYNCGQLDDGIQSDPFQMVLTPL
ncbi:MAG: IgGFc-binding protein, partial [Bacteroidota bacterium]